MVEIIAYTFCVMIIYKASKSQYLINIQHRRLSSSHKLSWTSIAIFTMLLVGVNYLYTYYSGISMSGDRTQYEIGYNNNASPSAGLLIIHSIGNYLGYNFNEFALLITGLSVPLFFIAYKYAKGATPLMILFFLLTPYIINGFDNFKQTFTNGFSCMLFSLLTYKRSVTIDILCILLIILGSAFHPTGFILIVFYIIFRLDVKAANIPLVFFCMFICCLFLPALLMSIAGLLGSAIPFLSDKIIQYFAEDSEMGEGRLIVAMKGLVYFYITAVLITNRSRLQDKIQHFGSYLIVSGFVCMLFLLSYYNVWMPRMAELFFFPIMFCWARSLRFIPNKNQNIFITCLLTGFFTYRLMWMTF